MDIVDLDKMYFEELSNHNELIAMTTLLQGCFASAIVFGGSVENLVSKLFEHIQKKEFDSASKMIKEAIFRIDDFVLALQQLSDRVKSSVILPDA